MKTKRPVAVRNLHPSLRFDRRAVVRAVRTLDGHRAALGTPESALDNAHELSIVFLTEEGLARLHADFLDDPAPTDVITFPGEPGIGAGSAGEICISVDAAVRYAAATDRNFSNELTLYLAHGWLHLAGHDDRAPGPRRAMRRAEKRAMQVLREAGIGKYEIGKYEGRRTK